jgi:ribosomal protein L11 methyltransferase
MPRSWPAVDVPFDTSPGVAADEAVGLILAAVDDTTVTAVLELPAGLRLFFTSSDARDRALGALAARGSGPAAAPVDVSDEDWARRSQENIGAVVVGRVRISPPWAVEAAGRDDGLRPDALVEVVIQPSMGFGTGHHATTRLCTSLLQQAELAGRRVLDVGTGSGVLAIVAARLGADRVLGIDDDADALESARENLDLNGLGGEAASDAPASVELRQCDFRDIADAAFDVVTANLTGGLLLKGADTLLAAVAPAGRLILSGITLEEEAAVRSRFEATLPLLARVEEDGWIGLLLGTGAR